MCLARVKGFDVLPDSWAVTSKGFDKTIGTVGQDPALLADPSTGPTWTIISNELERRSRAETNNAWGWREEDRWRHLADANRLQYNQDAAVGKVVMLAGPDWHGTFDLGDPAAQAVFDQEFQRRFATTP